jgi:transposase-like protein
LARREYSVAEKAAAVALVQSYGGNVDKAARELGFPSSSVRDWVAGKGVGPAVAEVVAEAKSQLADLFEDKVRLMLGGITEEKIATAKVGELMFNSAVGADKVRLLRGQATTIVEEVSLPVEEVAKRVSEIMDAARGRRALAVADRKRKGGVVGADAAGKAAAGDPVVSSPSAPKAGGISGVDVSRGAVRGRGRRRKE